MPVTVLVSALAGASGQQVHDLPPRPATGTAVISGVVLSGPTGTDPARKARVMLHSAGFGAVAMTATTDDEGRFGFRDLPAGRYTIEAVKTGYLTAAYGAARPNRAGTPVAVADGGRVSGLTIRLARGAAITGTVRDAQGAPVPGVQVSALKFTFLSAGQRRLSNYAGGLTDDRGIFRLWGLPPGEYVVMAAPRGDARAQSPDGSDFQPLSRADVDRALAAGRGATGGAAAPPPAPTENYAQVFHPSVTDLAGAATLSIVAGEERTGVDIGIRLVRTARVTATVRMPDGTVPARTAVTLSVAGEHADLLIGSVFRTRSVSLDASGQFAIADVAPGLYTVMAKTREAAQRAAMPGASQSPPSPNLWAGADIVIDGVDVNLSLEMQPAMTVSGRLVFDGPPPADPSMQIWMVPPGNVALNSGPAGGLVRSDRTFTFAGVTPGAYRMEFSYLSNRSLDPWFLRSAVANGRDTSHRRLDVAPGENIEWVLTFTNRPTEVAGVLQDPSGRPATDYFIVVFPREQSDQRPGSIRIRSTRPANDGAFSLRGLPPGDYLLSALTDVNDEDLNTPSFFDQLTPLALRITLAEGQVVRQDFKIER